MNKTYTVTWEITIDKTDMSDTCSPLEAASLAWEMRNREGSIANVFTVADDNDPGLVYKVDLSEEVPWKKVRRLKGREACTPGVLLQYLEMMVLWAELTVTPVMGEERLPRCIDKAKAIIKKFKNEP